MLQAEGACRRAMLRLGRSIDRPTLQAVLGLGDEDLEQACAGQDFTWEVRRREIKSTSY